eukprot:14696586-Heterocapsa_arctica.AAC.1
MIDIVGARLFGDLWASLLWVRFWLAMSIAGAGLACVTMPAVTLLWWTGRWARWIFGASWNFIMGSGSLPGTRSSR